MNQKTILNGSIFQINLQIQHNPYQNPAGFFADTDKLIRKFKLKFNGPRWPNNLKKNKVTGFILPDFETYCKATVTKTVLHCHKDSHRSMK